jgi:hypothetical protein
MEVGRYLSRHEGGWERQDDVYSDERKDPLSDVDQLQHFVILPYRGESGPRHRPPHDWTSQHVHDTLAQRTDRDIT